MEQLGIAAIGDEDLINGLRLAGVNKIYTINENEQNISETVQSALSDFIAEPDIGIIIVLENYMDFIKDIISKRKKDKKTIPVIIDVPPKSGSKYNNITSYYEQVIKESIGFEVRL
jgi:vacuolar-type H+-ATPase subunit F/Vma7